jgi:hypothetical protein
MILTSSRPMLFLLGDIGLPRVLPGLLIMVAELVEASLPTESLVPAAMAPQADGFDVKPLN